MDDDDDDDDDDEQTVTPTAEQVAAVVVAVAAATVVTSTTGRPFEEATVTSPGAAKRPSVFGFLIFNSWDWASGLLDFGRTVSMTCHEVLPPRRGCKRVCSNFSV